MTITQPCQITSRLLPGVRIGDAELSIEYAKRPGHEGRTRYQWHLDIPAGEFAGDDLQSGAQGGSLQSGLASLLSFLGAAGEAYAYQMRTGHESDNADLFPAPVMEWAHQYSDELGMLACEIEEAETPIIAE